MKNVFEYDNELKLYGVDPYGNNVVWSLIKSSLEPKLLISTVTFGKELKKEKEWETFSDDTSRLKRAEELLDAQLALGFTYDYKSLPSFKHEYITCEAPNCEDDMLIVEVWPNGSFEVVCNVNRYHPAWKDIIAASLNVLEKSVYHADRNDFVFQETCVSSEGFESVLGAV